MSERLRISVPALATLPVPRVPAVPPVPIWSVPAEIVVGPEKVFVPVSVQVLVPVFVRLVAPPASSPMMEASEPAVVPDRPSVRGPEPENAIAPVFVKASEPPVPAVESSVPPPRPSVNRRSVLWAVVAVPSRSVPPLRTRLVAAFVVWPSVPAAAELALATEATCRMPWLMRTGPVLLLGTVVRLSVPVPALVMPPEPVIWAAASPRLNVSVP